MSARTVVFIADTLPWLRIEDEAIVARGDHFAPEEGGDDVLVAIAPAHAVALHWLDLPGLAPAQARGAARLVAAEKSLISDDDAFVACGEQAEGEGARIVAIADRADIKHWIARLDPDVILPSPLLLDKGHDGFLRANLGHETVLRGADIGFADDEIVTPLVVGDASLETLEPAAVEAMIVASTHSPDINLRQGEFARKRDWAIDRRWLRQIGGAIAALLLISLAIPLIEIARLSWVTATVEQTSASLAQTALGEAVPADQAAASLDARLAAVRGGGAGFVATAGAVIQSIQTTANSELTAMSFSPDGIMRVTIRASTAAELDAAQVRMRGAGLTVTAGPVNPSQGQPIVDVEVRGQ
ncbi:MAG: type II secretion system protein GspL [Sphingomonadaceae bacterium]